MNYVLEIKKCNFKNEKGDEIQFYALSVVIDNAVIRLSVKEDDKKLFNYLLKFHKFDEKGGIVD